MSVAESQVEPGQPLISAEYQAQQRALHADPKYGVMSMLYAPMVSLVINHMQVKELLDYGCGKGRLSGALELDHPIRIHGYDPGVEAYSAVPAPAEMVACIDVLEHIEPQYLDAVLDDLKRLTQRLIFLTVHTGPAQKSLPDGRNAHLIQQPAAWWLDKLNARFEMEMFKEDHQGFWAVMAPKA